MKRKLLSIFFLVSTLTAFGQSKTEVFNEKNLKSNPAVQSYKIDKERQTPSIIKLNPNANFTRDMVVDFLMNALNIDGDSFTISENKVFNLKTGGEIVSYNASLNGVKLEHGAYKALIKNNKVKAITLEHYLYDNTATASPSLTNDDARAAATNHVGADVYVWENIQNELSQTVNIQEIQRLEASYIEHFPEGELVLVNDYKSTTANLKLAYKFNIYASEPLYRANVYVDANSGEILLADAIIKHADEINKKRKEQEAELAFPFRAVATGDTRYAGNRSFETTIDTSDPLNTRYSLDGTIDLSAYITDPALQIVLNETRSYDGVGGAPINVGGIPSYSIYDGFSRTEEGQTVIEVGDNNWSADEHWRNRFDTFNYPADNETSNDDIALDAHWGAEIVIQYWADVHGRSSYDNLGTKVTNYVHYGDAYDNAFWNGTAMTYGDGSYQGGTNPNGSFAPLTSMDVCGHEIGHGVCSATSDLVYARESGAMNEGFSDIWAAAVENYVLVNIDATLPYDPWGIGEQIDERDGGLAPGSAESRALRWMDDPKAAGDPDTYGGDNWQEPECGEPTLANDQCGVHTNSGVLNKWFYLLVKGSGQAYSPGRSKASSDDEVNDVLNSYQVISLGYDKAEQIAFQGEIMLTANAKFKDMRDASIAFAEAEYGAFSNEVEQVTNAWYAVGVGDQYIGPGSNIVYFDADNTSSIDEATVLNGCNESNQFTVDVSAVNVLSPQTVTFDFTDSTASAEDYAVSDTSFTFNADGTQTLTITVFNDALVEGPETIVVKFINGSETRVNNVVIKDDDYTPAIGSGTVELVNETFDTTTMPTGWTEQSELGVDPNIWLSNGVNPNAIGRAYVENRNAPGTGPNYNQAQDGNLLLVTNLIDARGISNVNLSFDWTAGGETEAADDSVLYDYGELLYSFDGSNFVSLETFVAVTGLETTASGTYNSALSVLDNTEFYVAWRWYNDALVGTEYSMTIDNVLVTGEPAAVESDVNSTDSETVKAGNEIFFISDQDAGVIAKIENATVDLGCVSLEVVSAGTGGDFSNIPGSYSGKVVQITADGVDAPTANYDITLYYSYSETSEFSDPNALQIIKVDGSAVDGATNSPSTNYTITGGLLEDNAAQQFRSYKGTFTGNSVFALFSSQTLSSGSLDFNSFNVYPTIVNSNSDIHIVNSKVNIESIDIYAINGVLLESRFFSGTNEISIPLTQYASGMYFMTINKNKANSYKFIVK
ncbi:MAG: T9SS type A sorting domain-containing protein [Winogradskyella sp.]|nr:T9SS type A sorting domain-containing protein [Winogradskyella sp.]